MNKNNSTYCKNCGAPLEVNQEKCSICGEKVNNNKNSDPTVNPQIALIYGPPSFFGIDEEESDE